jgi:formate/nitrite transporter FocA (FNT family)
MAGSGSDSPNLDPTEQERAARSEPLRGKEIHEILRKEGEAELERDTGPLIWTGLAAGLSMGFSFATQAILHAGLPEAPWRHLIASVGYSVGFAIVILGRQQLYTESTLTAVLPLLTNRDSATARATLRLWGWVLLANIVGTWIFALALAWGHPLPPDTNEALGRLASEAVTGTFAHTVLRGIFAGWLIALMVWLLPSARSARILVIVLITSLVALARLPHVIAGSSEAAYAVLTGARSFGDYWLTFFIPTLIGNTIGGVGLVAILNHAPVAGEVGAGEE